MAATEEPTHIIFLGNPGSGKSTLLNGIAQEVVFTSGLGEDGGGLTQEGSVIEAPLALKGPDGKLYVLCDTPGLMDAKRKQACVDIVNKALGEPRNTKIVFVVTWSVLDQDATTIHAMLEALNFDMEDKFGVIFNQVPSSEYEKIERGINDRAIDKCTKLLATTHKTRHITFVESLDELAEASNAIPPVPVVSKYLKFLGRIPPVRVEGDKFQPVTIERLENLAAMQAAEFAKMKQKNSELKERLDQISLRKMEEANLQAQAPQPSITYASNPMYTQPLQRTAVRTTVGNTTFTTYQYLPTYTAAPSFVGPITTAVPTTTTFYYPRGYYTYQPQVAPTCVQQ